MMFTHGNTPYHTWVSNGLINALTKDLLVYWLELEHLPLLPLHQAQNVIVSLCA